MALVTDKSGRALVIGIISVFLLTSVAHADPSTTQPKTQVDEHLMDQFWTTYDAISSGENADVAMRRVLNLAALTLDAMTTSSDAKLNGNAADFCYTPWWPQMICVGPYGAPDAFFTVAWSPNGGYSWVYVGICNFPARPCAGAN